MTLENQLLTTIRELPPELQQEVLDFAEFLMHRRPRVLERVLYEVRERTNDIEPDELDGLIEEARQAFAASRA